MKKISRRGFTLIELMVVMAIIAILAVLGLSALTSINTNNTLDRAAEEIVGAIRESQNLAISVASDPDCITCNAPLAWGVEVNGKTVRPFYLKASDKTSPTYGTALDYSTLQALTVAGDSSYFFTTPFGKYYSDGTASGITWAENTTKRPYDVQPTGLGSPSQSTITLRFRNATKVVVVEANGDTHVQ